MSVITITIDNEAHTIKADVDGETYDNLSQASAYMTMDWDEMIPKVRCCFSSREKVGDTEKTITITAKKNEKSPAKFSGSIDKVKDDIAAYLKGK